MLPATVREAIAKGPLAHVVALDPDGAPQVSLAWVGVDGDDLVIGTLFDQRKLRNLRRDPRNPLVRDRRHDAIGGPAARLRHPGHGGPDRRDRAPLT